MVRYKLDNVFYETTNPSKIERLEALGAKEVVEKELEDLTVNKLKELAKDAGIENFEKMKKAELIETLKAARGDSDDRITEEN